MLGRFFRKAEATTGARDGAADVAADAASVAAAVAHFETTTGHSAHPGASRVIGRDAQGVVVRVTHGYQLPPGRAWYRVGADRAVVAELALADVAGFGERPWR